MFWTIKTVTLLISPAARSSAVMVAVAAASSPELETDAAVQDVEVVAGLGVGWVQFQHGQQGALGGGVALLLQIAVGLRWQGLLPGPRGADIRSPGRAGVQGTR
jgi:hypothetical protein